MNIYCLTSIFSFIHNAIAYIEITGELTFDVLPKTVNGENNARLRDDSTIIGKKLKKGIYANTSAQITNIIPSKLKNVERQKENMTREVKEECVYQYPDRNQVEALLSDMMNQLTKIFVRAYDYIGARDRRRNKRFKIINKKFNTTFFENAYNRMSNEYRHSVNVTTNIAKLSNHNPCHHQTEIKLMWQNLLDQSKGILRKAAVRCISDFLRIRNRADDTRTKEKLGQLLLREIKEVRSNQLKVLCDEFKLCYKDLL